MFPKTIAVPAHYPPGFGDSTSPTQKGLCASGRPYVTDPNTGQCVCLCQLSAPYSLPPPAARGLYPLLRPPGPPQHLPPNQGTPPPGPPNYRPTHHGSPPPGLHHGLPAPSPPHHRPPNPGPPHHTPPPPGTLHHSNPTPGRPHHLPPNRSPPHGPPPARPPQHGLIPSLPLFSLQPAPFSDALSVASGDPLAGTGLKRDSLSPTRVPLGGPYTTAAFAAYHPYVHPGFDVGMRRTGVRETTVPLKAWLRENGKNPYPTKAEKIMLAVLTGLNLTQVATWFANARRRLKKEGSGESEGGLENDNVSHHDTDDDTDNTDNMNSMDSIYKKYVSSVADKYEDLSDVSVDSDINHPPRNVHTPSPTSLPITPLAPPSHSTHPVNPRVPPYPQAQSPSLPPDLRWTSKPPLHNGSGNGPDSDVRVKTSIWSVSSILGLDHGRDNNAEDTSSEKKDTTTNISSNNKNSSGIGDNTNTTDRSDDCSLSCNGGSSSFSGSVTQPAKRLFLSGSTDDSFDDGSSIHSTSSSGMSRKILSPDNSSCSSNSRHSDSIHRQQVSSGVLSDSGLSLSNGDDSNSRHSSHLHQVIISDSGLSYSLSNGEDSSCSSNNRNSRHDHQVSAGFIPESLSFSNDEDSGCSGNSKNGSHRQRVNTGSEAMNTGSDVPVMMMEYESSRFHHMEDQALQTQQPTNNTSTLVNQDSTTDVSLNAYTDVSQMTDVSKEMNSDHGRDVSLQKERQVVEKRGRDVSDCSQRVCGENGERDADITSERKVSKKRKETEPTENSIKDCH